MRVNTDILLQVLATSATVSATKSQCKCTPEDACWPSTADWSHLNTTLSGALIRATPPAAVCYPKEPDYNESACSIVRQRWFDSTFHASNPVSIDYPVWTNNSCNPIYPNGTSVTGDPHAGERGCDAETYPAFVVNATSASHAARSLKWAGEKNVRVVVKATGHSYTGRSTGAGSLSIWTHNIRGMEYVPSFLPTACPVDQPIDTVRVAAGHTGGEVQEYLSSYGRVIVSGANPSVGIVGWVTGGGHGYLSSTYGMGSDNLLEATIVLPSGDTVVTNPCQNPDIFFAVRGGGGGTFGIVTSVVLTTYPSPQTTQHVFTLASLPNTTETQFWDAMGFLHAHLQSLKDGGMQGYYYIVGPPTAPTLSLLWSFTLFNKPNGTIAALTAPLSTYLAARPALFTTTSTTTYAPSYFALAQHFTNEAVATGGGTYGSRLLAASSFSPATHASALLAAIGPRANASNPNGPVTNPLLIGHMVAAPKQPSYYPSVSSLNPAWRATLVHLIVSESWPDGAAPDVVRAVRADVTAKTGTMRDASPGMGAYFNEADSEEVGWQGAFFGRNYGRLVGVKRAVDPRGVLWCRKCVGSEAFVEEGGRLCRVRQEGWRGRV